MFAVLLFVALVALVLNVVLRRRVVVMEHGSKMMKRTVKRRPVKWNLAVPKDPSNNPYHEGDDSNRRNG